MDEPEFAQLNAPLLRHFAAAVRDLGGGPFELLQAAGISRDRWEQAESVTYPQMIRLLETAAQALGRPDFGMLLAARGREGAILGPLGQVMRNSRTFGDAVHFACEHNEAHSRAARLWSRQVPEEGLVFIAHELLLGNIADRSQAMEYLLLVGHIQAMEMTGGGARARRIHFRHEAVSPRHVYRRYFGCEVRFGQSVDGVAFSAADLSCPIIIHDGRVHRDMAAYVERHFPKRHLPCHAQVRGLVMRRIAIGPCSINAVAAAMNLNERTLRRRLRAEGRTFQEVKDEVRRELMLYYFEKTSLDLPSISERLGFAEQSILSRSCRKWFGQSPSQMRWRLHGRPQREMASKQEAVR